MNTFKRLATLAAIGGIGAGAYLEADALVKDVRFASAEQQVKVSREDLARVQDLANVFKEVGKAVSPSVVSIEVEKKVAMGGGGMPQGMPDLQDIPDRLKPFFDRNNDGEPDAPAAGRPRVRGARPRQRRHHGRQRRHGLHPDQQPRRGRRHQDERHP